MLTILIYRQKCAPIDLKNIDCNSFFIAAKDDHIAPWRSVYEGTKLLSGNKVFCLTDSGHIAGIVNPPSASKYNHRIHDNLSLSGEDWFMAAEEKQGSWWSYWLTWLKDNNKAKLTKSIDYKTLTNIEEAPGRYVRNKVQSHS
jgi:polyhydroxyalkanoate synthase